MKKTADVRGVRFYISSEQIREYLKISPGRRLDSLESACILTFKALGPKHKKIYNMFRRGKL